MDPGTCRAGPDPIPTGTARLPDRHAPMSGLANRPTRARRRPNGPVPDPAPGGLGPGDPLGRALVTCIRQVHARRRAGRALD